MKIRKVDTTNTRLLLRWTHFLVSTAKIAASFPEYLTNIAIQSDDFKHALLKRFVY